MTQIGQKLPNGAIVLATRPASGNYDLVLAFHPGSDDPFITWKVQPETGEAHWGTYRNDIVEAVQDYQERT